MLDFGYCYRNVTETTRRRIEREKAMTDANGIKEVAYVDCRGGGQVVVDGTTAYVGHTVGPEATTILDVSDPKNPKQIAQLQCAHQGVHAHKVRVQTG